MKLLEIAWNWLYPVEHEEIHRVRTGAEKARAAARINAVHRSHTGNTGTNGIHELKHAVKDRDTQGGHIGMRLHRNRLFPRWKLFVTWYQASGPRGIEEQIATARAPKHLMSGDDHRLVSRLMRWL